MTIEEFIVKLTNEEDFDIESIKGLRYLPIETKIDLMKAIVNTTLYTNGKFDSDRNARDVAFDLILIDSYTIIDVDFKKLTSEFNALDSLGLIDKIIAVCIPESEFDKLNKILENEVLDAMENKRSFASYLDEKIDIAKKMFYNAYAKVNDFLTTEEIKAVIDEITKSLTTTNTTTEEEVKAE